MMTRTSRSLVTTVVAVVVMTVGLAIVPAGAAFAEPAPSASCMGHEASAISPPGSSDEFQGGMPALKAFVDAAFPGLPPGVIYRTIAKLHQGSHEACDTALE